MIERIQNLLERVDPRQTWLVGVSGGRDSIALLELLVQVRFSHLVIVHVNHQLRGEESEDDEKFVEALAVRCGIPFYSESVDVKVKMESEQKGLEVAAREARHAVYAKAQKKFEAVGVLLGHHADDQAETVLYNLLRGSNGLKGIRYENSVRVGGIELRLVRPLLEIRRAEINDYIEQYEIEYREDASNAEAFTARNRIRNEVMPLLKDIMKREVVPSINAAAEVSVEQNDFLAREIQLEQLLDPQGRLFLPALSELEVVLQQLVLFQYLQEQRVPNISRELVERCLRIMDKDSPAKCNLPGGRWLRRKEQRLFIKE